MKTNPREVADGVLCLRTIMVNVFVIREGSSWVLIDCGLRGHVETIRRAAQRFVGDASPPAVIVLTHAHFDHVGSLPGLLEAWNVPVYALPLERPYLTGESSYPPPDPLVGGGAMALMSRLYPRGPIDVRRHLRLLGEGPGVPELSGWRWLHTPGHCRGRPGLWARPETPGELLAHPAPGAPLPVLSCGGRPPRGRHAPR